MNPILSVFLKDFLIVPDEVSMAFMQERKSQFVFAGSY